MLIKSALKKFGVALTPFTLLGMVGCGTQTTPAVTETEYEVCRAWQNSLPTRSRSDTKQTQDEIGLGYDVFSATFPDGCIEPS